MVSLNETKNAIWNNNWPQIIAKNSVENKTYTTNKINDSNFLYIFQNKA